MNKAKLFYYNFYSLFFCLRYLPLKQAIKIPILIHPSVKVKIDRSSSIIFPDRIWRSMFSLGFPAREGRSNGPSLLFLCNGAQLIVRGFTIISKGTHVTLNGGKMDIGSKFICNGDCSFNSTSLIKIGEQNMYGWDVHFNTTDGHHIIIDGQEKLMEKEIIIGNHVWIASYSRISKGTVIASHCVVAQCSLVIGTHNEEHCLIGGMPAHILKHNINWYA